MARSQQFAENAEKIAVTGTVATTSNILEMERRSVKNEELDLIAKRLIRSAVLRDDQIENIVSDTSLFRAVQDRIRSEQKAETRTSYLAFLLKPQFVAGCAAVAVIVLAIFGLMLIKSRTIEPVDIVKIPQRKANLPDMDDREFVAPQPRRVSPAIESPRAEPIAYPASAKPKRQRPTSRPIAESQPEVVAMEFYPLEGVSPESIRSGRVVRVDLPRASLIALGANLPLDSGNAVVKTDVLLSADGVPRAIRLVE